MCRLTPALAVVVALLVPRGARAELASVWALDDGTKLLATDTAHPLEGGNGTFDPAAGRITLFGARNETVAFQVILEGGAVDTPGVRLRLPAIGDVANDGAFDDFDGADWDRYWLGRRIEVFEVGYLEVTTRSHDLAWEPGSAAEPAGMEGWIPDPLVPLDGDDTVTVPAGRNQGLWVDVWIPKGTAPGRHTGTLTIEVDGSPCPLEACTLEVALDVLDATLPDEPSVETMLYFSGGDGDRDQMYARYDPNPWDASAAEVEPYRNRHFRLGRRHRITMFIGEKDEPDAALTALFDGSVFSRAGGYEGPGEGLAPDMYSIHTYGGTLTTGEASQWASWFAAHGPDAETFLYITDEPGSGDFGWISAASATASAGGIAGFVTHEPAPGLDVDIYCAWAGAWESTAAHAAVAEGKRVWVYNGTRPYSGTFVIDDVATSPRVNPLIQLAYDVPRWFYWESTYYTNWQGGEGPTNVFEDPVNFSNSWGDEMNGDGLLVYPGRDVLFPAEDRGMDQPLPSIRLKAWRRGLQDAEYILLARAAGEEALADEVLSTLVPAALDDVEGGEAVAWEEDGEVWLAQRRRLAALFLVDGDPGIDDDPTDERRCGCASTRAFGGAWLLLASLAALRARRMGSRS